MRIKDTDKLRARVFKSTRTRTERFEAERAGFRGGMCCAIVLAVALTGS